MAIIYASSMDHYGPSGGANHDVSGEVSWTLDNPTFLGDGWSNLPVATFPNSGPNIKPTGILKIATPAWGARQGDRAFMVDGANIVLEAVSSVEQQYSRPASAATWLPIPGALTHTRYIHFAFSLSELPSSQGQGEICHFINNEGEIRATLRVDSSGRLQIRDGGLLLAAVDAGPAKAQYDSIPTVLASSAGSVVTSSTWYYFSIRVVTNGLNASADIDVYSGDIIPENLVLSATGLAFTAPSVGSNHIATLGFLPITLTPSIGIFGDAGIETIPFDASIRAIRDIVLVDETGTENTGLLGQVFVSAQAIRIEDGSNWSAFPRENISVGILNHSTNQTGLRFADSPDFNLGTGDFTFETFIRFNSLPDTNNLTNIVTKWRAEPGKRSYRLYYDGATDRLIWQVSTTGSDEIQVKAVEWIPETGKWYHVAVSRSSGNLQFFIDGLELGVPTTDANNYFDSSQVLGIGVTYNGVVLVEDDTRFDGWMDETRFTVGVGRYTADFTPPTAPFGRTVGEDADFNSVVLLLGYDNETISDESSHHRSVSLFLSAPVVAEIPNDGEFSYQVLNDRPAHDDTFIEAALLFAEGLLTIGSPPLDGETVTLGTQTYTWRTAFTGSPENEVLIAPTIDESISRLVAAINGDAGEGTIYGTGTVANTSVAAFEFFPRQMKVRALTAGAAGNLIATTETMTAGEFRSVTLQGGQDIPAPSKFSIQRLPLEATNVLAAQMTARAYKTSAGSATLRFDLVGPGGGVAQGSLLGVDLSPAWTRQVFEIDPDTSAGITPSTLAGGKIRFVRTS